jgi:hypothetical protein
VNRTDVVDLMGDGYSLKRQDSTIPPTISFKHSLAFTGVLATWAWYWRRHCRLRLDTYIHRYHTSHGTRSHGATCTPLHEIARINFITTTV